MRKKISCKVIRSVPLIKSDDALWNRGKPSFRRPKTADVAALSYTDRLVVTKARLDDVSAARTLDLYA